jgi:hypothetical protein
MLTTGIDLIRGSLGAAEPSSVRAAGLDDVPLADDAGTGVAPERVEGRTLPADGLGAPEAGRDGDEGLLPSDDAPAVAAAGSDVDERVGAVGGVPADALFCFSAASGGREDDVRTGEPLAGGLEPRRISASERPLAELFEVGDPSGGGFDETRPSEPCESRDAPDTGVLAGRALDDVGLRTAVGCGVGVDLAESGALDEGRLDVVAPEGRTDVARGVVLACPVAAGAGGADGSTCCGFVATCWVGAGAATTALSAEGDAASTELSAPASPHSSSISAVSWVGGMLTGGGNESRSMRGAAGRLTGEAAAGGATGFGAVDPATGGGSATSVLARVGSGAAAGAGAAVRDVCFFGGALFRRLLALVDRLPLPLPLPLSLSLLARLEAIAIEPLQAV